MIGAAAMVVSLLGQANPAPDYGKLLPQAKLTLSEAIDKAAKEVPGGTVVSAYLEDEEGHPRYFLYVAKDKQTTEISLDIKDGTVTRKTPVPDDDSKIVSAVKIKLAAAIQSALRKVPGKAVYADFDLDDSGPAEAEVDVFAGGKVTKVYVSAVTGVVTKTDP